MSTSTPQDRQQMSPAQKAAYDAARDLANRTNPGEEILNGAGTRLSPASTADLVLETGALVAGARYLAKFIAPAPFTGIGFITQTTTPPVDATNAGYPIQHGESVYIRIPRDGVAQNRISCLFPNAGSILNVIRSDARGEEDGSL